MKQGWEIKNLGEVCDFENGDRGVNYPSKSHRTKTGIPFINAGHLTSNGIDISNMDFISRDRYNLLSNGKIQKGDILFCLRGSLGKYANVGELSEGAIASSLVIVRPKPVVIRAFIMAYFGSRICAEMIIMHSNGAAQPNLSAQSLRKFQIPIPPLPEQQRMVAILDEAFAAIAKAKANTEQNLKNARELFESYLQSVFTNKGKGWENKTLNQISENLDSRRVPITHNVRKKGSVPYYGASGIVDYVEDYLFDDDLLLVSEDGANLLARTYPIAFSIKGKSWVNNHAHILKFKNLASQKFVEYYLNSIKLDDYVSGMAQPKLNQKMLNSIIIPFPSLIEQQAIIDNLNVFSEKTNKLEVIYQKRLNCLENLKKSILQKAFAGELRGSDLIYKNR
ncbi:MAG TPA: restriction endonuclease subunit S [Rikenellaceae bacterium]|nr:restriction endonuclease subunit S [Rikenellaceae bacterium]